LPKTEIRPTFPSDLSAVIGEALPFRIRALTVLIDGRVVGIGGLAFPPSGPVIAFVQQSPDARKFKVAFHKAGRAAMRMIEESGVNEVVSTADEDDPVALRWLERLGFARAQQQNIPGRVLYVWRRRDAVSSPD
jgi:RimJ/RimL family protein N-acetyltransferase